MTSKSRWVVGGVGKCWIMREEIKIDNQPEEFLGGGF